MTQTAIDTVTNDALDAFWQVVVRRFPEATDGDLSIDRTIALDIAAKEAVREWVSNNVPDTAATPLLAREEERP